MFSLTRSIGAAAVLLMAADTPPSIKSSAKSRRLMSRSIVHALLRCSASPTGRAPLSARRAHVAAFCKIDTGSPPRRARAAHDRNDSATLAVDPCARAAATAQLCTAAPLRCTRVAADDGAAPNRRCVRAAPAADNDRRVATPCHTAPFLAADRERDAREHAQRQSARTAK